MCGFVCCRMSAIRLPRSRFAAVIILAVLIFAATFLTPMISFNPPACQIDPSKVRFSMDNTTDSPEIDYTPDKHILAPDLFLRNFKMEGHRFDNKGVATSYEHMMTSSVIHSFSPYTENRMREIMLDPRQEQRIYANRSVLTLNVTDFLNHYSESNILPQLQSLVSLAYSNKL